MHTMAMNKILIHLKVFFSIKGSDAAERFACPDGKELKSCSKGLGREIKDFKAKPRITAMHTLNR